MQHVDDGTLQAWLDTDRAALSPAERREIERHLSACPACARRAQEAEALDQRARALLAPPDAGAEAVPPFEAVVARARGARAEGRIGGARPRVWSAAAWAATVVLALGVGWWASTLSHGGRGDRVAVTAPARATGPAAAPSSMAGAPAPTEAPAGVQARVPATPPVQVAEAPARKVESPQAPQPAVRVAAARGRVADREQPPDSSAVRAGTETAGVPLAAAEANARQAGVPPQAPAAAPVEKAIASAPAAVVRGRVTDESGHPLASASVMLNGTRTGALTNADGTFSLPLGALSPDSATRQVTVTATLLGYSSASQSLAVRSGSESFAELRLEPRAVALEGIVAVGYGSKATAPAVARSAVVWTPATRADAERQAGFALVTVPDLALVRIEVSDGRGGTRVRVAQRLDGGGLLELVEAREPLAQERAAAAGSGSSASTRRGDVYIVAAAPIDGSALGELLARLH